MSPKFRRSLYRNHFKIDQVAPALHPFFNCLTIWRFHNLEAAHPSSVHPAGLVGDSFRKHSSLLLESLADCGGIAVPECLYHHKEHGRILYVFGALLIYDFWISLSRKTKTSLPARRPRRQAARWNISSAIFPRAVRGPAQSAGRSIRCTECRWLPTFSGTC